MKKFVYHISYLILILVGLMYGLDFIYSQVYLNGTFRNKVMWMHQMENESLDYVVFGSSRANNYIIPDTIFKKTGQSGLNLAIQASGPLEIELAVREFLKRNSAKRIFIQVDHWYNHEKADPTGQLSWLPFIVDDSIYEVFKPYGHEYWYYKNIPFYRYLMFDSRIGYRDIILSMMKKGIDYNDSKGFTESKGRLKNDKPYKFSLNDKPNQHFISINQICRERNIHVVYFTSPIYRPEGNFEILNQQLPNYHDLSKSVQSMELFSDPHHLNKTGAIVFTDIFMDVFFDYSW